MVMDNMTPSEEQNFGDKLNFDSGSSVPVVTSAQLVKNRNKSRYIIFGGLVILMLVLGIIALIVLRSMNDISDVDGTTTDDNNVSDTAVTNAFKNLTKAEAVAFLQSRTDGTIGLLPEGYVGEEIVNSIIMSGYNVIVSDLDLAYSYGDMEELEQLIRRNYSSFSLSRDEVDINDFEIKEYDHYVIVTPKRIKGATTCDHGYYYDCDSLLSFKRDYFNYLSEKTSPNSSQDAFYINTSDPEIVNELLRAYTFFVSIGFGGGHGNIYSYSFEEQEDRFILSVNYVGVGLNIELLDKPDSNIDMSRAYAINLFTRRYAVDKSNGRVYIVPVQTEPEVVYSDNVKSFSITKEEMTALLGYDD